MASRRTQKAAAAVREVVSMAILADLKDPRVRDVTVTFVEVTPDMRQAKVHVSIMGDETKQNLGLRGLQNAAGFLQSKLSNRIETRYTPRLEFVLDQGVKKSIEIAKILGRVLPPSERDAANAAADRDEGENEFEEDLDSDLDDGGSDDGTELDDESAEEDADATNEDAGDDRSASDG